MKTTSKFPENKTIRQSVLTVLASISLLGLTNCTSNDDQDRSTTTTTTTEETTLRTPTTVIPLSTTVETKTRRNY
jgi:hypothetical protein